MRLPRPSALGPLGLGLNPARASSAAASCASSPARSPAWPRSASWRACATCSSAARRTRSSSARADSAASRARAASCPASSARDSAWATRDSASAARDCAPRTASSRSCRAAAACSCAARACCSAAVLRFQRLGQPRLSPRHRGRRLPRIRLGPLTAPPEHESRPSRVPRFGRPAALSGQHLTPPDRGQRADAAPRSPGLAARSILAAAAPVSPASAHSHSPDSRI